jgi:hypothetical protein
MIRVMAGSLLPLACGWSGGGPEQSNSSAWIELNDPI